MSNLKPQRGWTADEESTIRRMVAAHATASQMAKALGNGRTRNAVIGKVGRLGLKFTSGETSGARLKRQARVEAKAKGRHERPAAPAAAPLAPSPKVAPQPAPAIVAAPPPAVGAQLDGVSLLALEAAMCRATVGQLTGADQRFCGAPTRRVPSGSRSGIAGFETYCDDCRGALSKPVPPRARAAAR